MAETARQTPRSPFYLHFICSGRKFCAPFCEPVSARRSLYNEGRGLGRCCTDRTRRTSSCRRRRGRGNSWLSTSKRALYERQIYAECRRRRNRTRTSSWSSWSSESAGDISRVKMTSRVTDQ